MLHSELPRRILCALFLALLAMPAPVAAQDEPPLPRPRIDRGDSGPSEQGTVPHQGNSALDALSDAIQDEGRNPDGPPHASGPPQPVTLSAKITDAGTMIPDGLIWRIFDSRTDESGQLALLAKSTDGVASFELPPGDYLVHVAYGRSQATDAVHVEMGSNSKTLILDSGALRLNAAIEGEIPIRPEQLNFQVHGTDDSGRGRVMIADDIAPRQLVHLNAGVYEVVSHFGDNNARVRADLRVEPGQITDATLYHKARSISFKLVSEEGGEAIADVDWTVNQAGGEQTVFSDFGAFPSAILAEGDYTVIAQRGDNVYNRDFEVTAGEPREIELLTSVYAEDSTERTED